MKVKMWTGGILTFVSIFYAIGFFLIGSGLFEVYKNHRVKNWAIAEGKIVLSDLKEKVDSEDGVTYTVEVNYIYHVDGKKYIGDKISYGYNGGGNKELQEKILDKLKSGGAISVRYNANNPTESVISYGLSTATLLKLIFGTTWMLVLIGLSLLMLAGNYGERTVIENIKPIDYH